MYTDNSAHRAVRSRQRRVPRKFGDGRGRMTEQERREAWQRGGGRPLKLEPFVVPCAVAFLLGGFVMAVLLSA